MAQTTTLNPAQMQLLDMMSFVKTPEALHELNKVISDYFVQKDEPNVGRRFPERRAYRELPTSPRAYPIQPTRLVVMNIVLDTNSLDRWLIL